LLSFKVKILIPPAPLPGGKNPSGINKAFNPKVDFGMDEIKLGHANPSKI